MNQEEAVQAVQAVRDVEAAFVAAVMRARSFQGLMANEGSRQVLVQLFEAFKNVTEMRAQNHATVMKSWLIGQWGGMVPQGQDPYEVSRLHVRQLLLQVVDEQGLDIPDSTAVLLLRIGLFMYRRVHAVHPGPIHQIPLVFDKEAFNADPIALECAKYILTGDTTGTIFKRQPGSPPPNPKDVIRTHAMANLQVSTLMKAVMASFYSTVKVHVHQTVGQLRALVARGPDEVKMNFNMPLGDPQAAEEKSLAGLGVSRMSRAFDLKFKLMQAAAKLGDTVAQRVSKNYRVSVIKSERVRLEAEKSRYNYRLTALHSIALTLKAYSTIFRGYEHRLESFVFIVEPVAKTTDAAILVSQRASRALTEFVHFLVHMNQPGADREASDPPGLGVFRARIPRTYAPLTGVVEMVNVVPGDNLNGPNVTAAYNKLIYMAVLMICVIGKDEEIARVVSVEQMHLHARLNKLASRVPVDQHLVEFAQDQAAGAALAEVRSALAEVENLGAAPAPVALPPVPNDAERPSANAIGDILALSSLFPVAESDHVDHLLAFVLTESNIINQSLINERFASMALRAVEDREDFAVGTLETVSDFLGVLAPRDPVAVKSTMVSDAALVKKVADDVVQRIGPVIQQGMNGAFGEQRETLAKSIVTTNEARRKYEQGIAAMSGKQHVFLQTAYADQVPLDKLDEASIKAVHSDFLDEMTRMKRVVDALPNDLRLAQIPELQRVIALFFKSDASPDDVTHVAWATPLLEVFRAHSDTHLMTYFVLDQLTARLQTRWLSWVASSGFSDQRVQDALTQLMFALQSKKVEQFHASNDQRRYEAWASFIRTLPVTRPDDHKTLDDRSAELLKEKTRLVAENTRLKQLLEDEKKAMRERSRNDMAKIDLQRQRDADDFENRVNEMKLKATQARFKDDQKVRVNDRVGTGAKASAAAKTGPGATGQAYVLNGGGHGESSAARVMDLAMDPIGLRLPMGFMHPFEAQFRPGYRRGFNPLFWYQLLREFVRTVATTSNLAADRCLVDAMPDASLAQYAAFYEPQGYDAATDQFKKDFSSSDANQLVIPGRTAFGNTDEVREGRLIVDGNITPFIKTKLKEKFRNVEEFMSTAKVRAAHARLELLKANELRGTMPRAPQPPAVVHMRISRELTPPETDYLDGYAHEYDTGGWKSVVLTVAEELSREESRNLRLVSIGNFVVGDNAIRDRTTAFMDYFNAHTVRPLLNDEKLLLYSMPTVLLLGSEHKPHVTLVECAWTFSAQNLRTAPFSRVYYALEKAANDTKSTGSIIFARCNASLTSLDPGLSFVPSSETLDAYLKKPDDSQRRQFVRTLTLRPAPEMIDFLFSELERIRTEPQVSYIPAQQPIEIDSEMEFGDMARHGPFISHAARPAPERKNDDRDDDEDAENLDDFLAAQAVFPDPRIEIGNRPLEELTIEELEAYQKEHLELRDHVRELAGQEAKFIAEMKRLSRVHAGNMENVLGEYLAPEPPLSGIKQALHYARQLFRKTRKESSLLLAEFLVSSVANDDFAALVVAYIRKNNSMANNVVATKQLVMDTNQMLGKAQRSMEKLAYMPKRTPFKDLSPEDDPHLNGQPYSDYFYAKHEREDFQEADSFTRRF